MILKIKVKNFNSQDIKLLNIKKAESFETAFNILTIEKINVCD